MPDICVVLVDPKHECNVGFVARAMKNFSIEKLYFSGKDFSPGEKAFECAAHAKDVLSRSQHLKNKPINEAFDIVIGTTAKPLPKETSPRIAITPDELNQKLKNLKGRAAIVFGREDTGLNNEELEVCDLVVFIPASPGYPTLNISHAAAVLFYELTKTPYNAGKEFRMASGVEKEALMRRLETLLESIKYPNYKKKVAVRIFRKVIGRSGISGREAHTLAGIFKEADDHIKRIERKD